MVEPTAMPTPSFPPGAKSSTAETKLSSMARPRALLPKLSIGSQILMTDCKF
jgi:hypothetical protein